MADVKKDANDLVIIDKVIDINYIQRNPGKSGIELYWSHNLVRTYTDSDYNAYIKT